MFDVEGSYPSGEWAQEKRCTRRTRGRTSSLKMWKINSGTRQKSQGDMRLARHWGFLRLGDGKKWEWKQKLDWSYGCFLTEIEYHRCWPMPPPMAIDFEVAKARFVHNMCHLSILQNVKHVVYSFGDRALRFPSTSCLRSLVMTDIGDPKASTISWAISEAKACPQSWLGGRSIHFLMEPIHTIYTMYIILLPVLKTLFMFVVGESKYIYIYMV